MKLYSRKIFCVVYSDFKIVSQQKKNRNHFRVIIFYDFLSILS